MCHWYNNWSRTEGMRCGGEDRTSGEVVLGKPNIESKICVLFLILLHLLQDKYFFSLPNQTTNSKLLLGLNLSSIQTLTLFKFWEQRIWLFNLQGLVKNEKPWLPSQTLLVKDPEQLLRSHIHEISTGNNFWSFNQA